MTKPTPQNLPTVRVGTATPPKPAQPSPLPPVRQAVPGRTANGEVPSAPVNPAPSAPPPPLVDEAKTWSIRQNSNAPNPKLISAPNAVVHVNVAPAVLVGGLAPQVQYSVAGKRLTVISSNVPIQIQTLPGGRKETYYPGQTVNFQNSFDFVLVSNSSATTPLVATLLIGFADLENYTTPSIPAVPVQVMTSLTTPGAVQQISTVDAWVKKVWLYAYVGFTNGIPTGNNLGTIWAGKSKAFLPTPLTGGQWTPFEFPDGQWFNLANCYFTGNTAGDGIFADGT